MRIRGITHTKELSQINAVYRTAKPEERSATYTFVDTRELVSQIESKGWRFERGQHSRTGTDKGAHLLVFRNDSIQVPDLGSATSIPELIVVNSHDGTAAVKFALGLFRMACLNGILAGLSFKSFKAVHSARGVERISDGIDFVTGSVNEELARVKEWSQVQLTEPQRMAFVQACLNRRLESVRGEILEISHHNPRRVEDLGGDAYTVLNRGQELLMRGGFQYLVQSSHIDDSGVERVERRHATARPIYSVGQSLALNKFAVETMTQLLLQGGNL